MTAERTYKWTPEAEQAAKNVGADLGATTTESSVEEVVERAIREGEMLNPNWVRDALTTHAEQVRREDRERIIDDRQFRFDALLKNYSEDRPVPPAVIRMELEAIWKALTTQNPDIT